MNTMNVINLMSTSESRVLPILEEAISSQPDIIALQELFHPFLAAHIAIPFFHAHGYSVAYAARGSHAFGMNSGCLIASKFAIVAAHFKPYLNPTGLNKFAKKGVVAIKIKLSDSVNIVVSNTHALCDEEYPAGSNRNEYLLKIYGDHFQWARNFSEDFCCTTGNVRAVIAMGDFNVNRFNGNGGLPDIYRMWDYKNVDRFLLSDVRGATPAFKDLTKVDVAVPTSITRLGCNFAIS